MDFGRLALRNLRRNLKRNLATGSAIAFGFAGILLLSGYSYRIKNYLRVYTVYVVHTGHLAIFADGGFEKFPFDPARYSLSADDQKLIDSVLRADPQVEIVERQIRGQGLIGNGCSSLPFAAQGLEPAVDEALRSHAEVKKWMPDLKFFLAGRGIWNFPESLNAVILSKALALALGKTHTHDELGDAPVTIVNCANEDMRQQLQRDANVQLLSSAWQGGLSAVDGEIVARFTTGMQESDNAAVIANLSLLQKLFTTDHVTQMSVWLKDPARMNETAKRLQDQFTRAGKKFEIFHWDNEKISPYYAGTMGFLDTMVSAVSLFLACIIALSVLNSTTMTILERSQEIGMYRSMGFRRAHVRALYLLESLWLSLLSLTAGSVLAAVAAASINAAGVVYHPPGVANGMKLMLIINWTAGAKSGIFILLLVLAATFFAVSNRLKFKPADLLGGTLR